MVNSCRAFDPGDFKPNTSGCDSQKNGPRLGGPIRYYLMPSRTHLASTADGVRPWRHAYFGQTAKYIEAHFAFSRWLNLAQAAVGCIYNTTVFVYSRCYALMRRGPDDEQALFLRRDSRHVILGNLTVDTSTELSVSSSQRRTLCSRGLLLYG